MEGWILRSANALIHSEVKTSCKSCCSIFGQNCSELTYSAKSSLSSCIAEQGNLRMLVSKAWPRA